jgi:hypothetical protein
LLQCIWSDPTSCKLISTPSMCCKHHFYYMHLFDCHAKSTKSQRQLCERGHHKTNTIRQKVFPRTHSELSSVELERHWWSQSSTWVVVQRQGGGAVLQSHDLVIQGSSSGSIAKISRRCC